MARTPLFRLDGRTALVTGSTRGIGLAAAQALGAQGATVVINGRQAEQVQQVVEGGRALGLDFRAMPFDVGDLAASEQAVERIGREIGPIDILFANAGIQHREALLDFPQAEFERVLSFNLTAQWAMARQVARGMTERGWGRILFTGSITAVLGRERVTAYTAAKGALPAQERQWSSELTPQGVTINAIAPGYIQTELTQALGQYPQREGWL